MPIKTFRGKLADNELDTISLHTRTGSVGYRIVKFELFVAGDFGTVAQESMVKIYKTPQTTATGTVDFSDQTLLAAGLFTTNSTPAYPTTSVAIFDTDVVNQDIYITHLENNGSQEINYYIELEQVKLDLNENTVATLKDIRNLS